MLLDATLIFRAQQHDSQALATIVELAKPLIVRQLARYPVSEEDRRDLLQNTLMQIVRKISSFRGDANFTTWLFRVTANEALMLMRSQRRARARLVHGLDNQQLENLANMNVQTYAVASDISQQRHTQLQHAVNNLPESYKSVVVAHYHQELGLKEIAQRMGMTESAVRSRLHRTRSRLRTILGVELPASTPASAIAAA